MKAIIIITIIFNLLMLGCQSIRQRFIDAEKDFNEKVEKSKSREGPILEVRNFSDYVDRIKICFDNRLDDSAIKFIQWYPDYHRELIDSFTYGTLITLFSKRSSDQKNRYYDFVDWYTKLDK